MLNLKSAQKNGVADTINYANLEHHPQEIEHWSSGQPLWIFIINFPIVQENTELTTAIVNLQYNGIL